MHLKEQKRVTIYDFETQEPHSKPEPKPKPEDRPPGPPGPSGPPGPPGTTKGKVIGKTRTKPKKKAKTVKGKTKDNKNKPKTKEKTEKPAASSVTLPQEFLDYNASIAFADLKGNKVGTINVTKARREHVKKLAIDSALKDFGKPKNKKERKKLINFILQSGTLIRMHQDYISYVFIPMGSTGLDKRSNESIAEHVNSYVSGQPDELKGFIKIIFLLYASQGKMKEMYDTWSYIIKQHDEDLESYFKKIKKINPEPRPWKSFFEDEEISKILSKVVPKTYAAFNNLEGSAPVSTDNEIPKPQQESTTMNKNDIKQLIKEAFTDNIYGKYPYSHRAGDDDEPKEDYVEDWKKFCLSIVQDKSKEQAIALAKIFIQDLELFEDVLDLAGQNQSIGSEILKKMQKNQKNMV
jgi:hypothetical protein